MGASPAVDLVRRELDRALRDAHHCIDRVELAAAILTALNAPVPEYEPHLRHLPFNTKMFELPNRRNPEH